MTIATEMKELTRDIASSYAERMRRIGEIREEANLTRGEAEGLIKSFEASRNETGRQLRRELARDKASRESEVTGMLKEAQNILRANQTSRNEASAQLRESLTSGTANRRSEVRKTLQDAQQSIRGFGASLKKAGSELRRNLDESRMSVKSDVSELLGNAQGLIRNFQKSRIERGIKLRKDMARDRSDRESDVRQMQNDIRKARANTQAELKEAAAAWTGLTKVTPPPKEEVPEMEEAKVVLPEEQAPNFEVKLLEAVNEHPEGITLSAVADSLGVAPIVLGRASRSLLDKGEIYKEEKTYFPVTSK
jgi:hypothetical protein